MKDGSGCGPGLDIISQEGPQEAYCTWSLPNLQKHCYDPVCDRKVAGFVICHEHRDGSVFMCISVLLCM